MLGMFVSMIQHVFHPVFCVPRPTTVNAKRINTNFGGFNLIPLCARCVFGSIFLCDSKHTPIANKNHILLHLLPPSSRLPSTSSMALFCLWKQCVGDIRTRHSILDGLDSQRRCTVHLFFILLIRFRRRVPAQKKKRNRKNTNLICHHCRFAIYLLCNSYRHSIVKAPAKQNVISQPQFGPSLRAEVSRFRSFLRFSLCAFSRLRFGAAQDFRVDH